jgi:hypothetical protein
MLAFICIAAVTAGLSTPGTAWALLDNLLQQQKQVHNQIPLDKIYPVQDEDTFEGVAKSFHGTPFNDPQLEYEITMPKDWTYQQTAQVHDAYGVSRELMGDLAHFKSPVINTMEAVITIQSIKLTREVSAENWLKDYMFTTGCDLQDTVIPVDLKKASANCISTVEGKSDYIYMTMQINGSNAVVVRFESPLALKDALAFVRKRIVDSFRFILKTDNPIEVQKSFNFADALKFSYPQSLVINHIDDKDTRHMSMQLYNQSKGARVDGLIRFQVAKRSTDTNLNKEIGDLKSFIDNFLGIECKKLISSDKAPVADRFIFSRYEVYQVASKQENAIDQELRLVVLGDHDWYIFAFLLTPSENVDFPTWANNVQDFDMIVRDFR